MSCRLRIRERVLQITAIGVILWTSCGFQPAHAQGQLTPAQMAFLANAPVEQVEAALRDGLMAQIESQNVVYSDPRVERIFSRLQDVCPRKDLRIRVIQSPEVNASTYPGGLIYIYSGLIEAMGSDDDAVAFAIAHEMGHARRYHPGLGTQENFRKTIAAPARTPGEQLGKTLADGIFGKSTQRDYERQADNDGVRFILAAGFDPEGVFRGFDVLDRQPRENVLKWFFSHPNPMDRKKRLHDFLDRLHGTPKQEAKGKGSRESLKPRKGEKISLAVKPEKVSVAPGTIVPVTYQFTFPKEQMLLHSRSAFFTSPDGAHLSETIGPYETAIGLGASGKFQYKDRPLLPQDVVDKAREKGLDTVILVQSFHGQKQNGDPVDWTTSMRIRIKK